MNAPEKTLQSSFDDQGDLVTAYDHPHAQAILDETIHILQKSTVGSALYQMSLKYDMHPKVITSPIERGFAMESGEVFLAAPPSLKATGARQALDLAGALREAELNMLGFKNPGPGSDPLDYALINHGRALDVIITTCRVAQDLQNINDYGNILDILDAMGHSDIYRVFVSSGNSIEVAESYLNTE